MNTHAPQRLCVYVWMCVCVSYLASPAVTGWSVKSGQPVAGKIHRNNHTLPNACAWMCGCASVFRI